MRLNLRSAFARPRCRVVGAFFYWLLGVGTPPSAPWGLNSSFSLRESPACLVPLAERDFLRQNCVADCELNTSSPVCATNLQAWLFTILRNLFYSKLRRRRLEVEDADGVFAQKLAVSPEQGGHLDLADLKTALGRLSPEQREAVILVGAEGLTYDQAAEVCGTVVGTIKSRVNRGRHRLAELMHTDPSEDFATDGLLAAARQAA